MSHAPASTLTLPSAPRTGFQLGGCATDPASPGAPPGQVPPPRPTATSGRVLPSWRGDTIHQVFCWKHHQCPPVVSWRKAWRGEGVGVTSAVPELLAASAKPPRPFLQQVLLWRLRASAQSGSQTDTQTGTHGGTAPSRQRGWRRRHRSAGGRRGTPRTSSQAPGTSVHGCSGHTGSVFISSRESSHDTRTGVGSCRPPDVCVGSVTQMSRHTRMMIYTHM